MPAAKDKNYNLVTVLQQSLENSWTLSSYIEDAQNEGDQELVDFFTQVQQHNIEGAEQAKHLLATRLQKEGASGA